MLLTFALYEFFRREPADIPRLRDYSCAFAFQPFALVTLSASFALCLDISVIPCAAHFALSLLLRFVHFGPFHN